jgi:multiple sugar transport system ATP-binding protein
MNQLDAVVGNEAGAPVARLADGVMVPLPADIAATVIEGQQVVLGFRPESFAPAGHSLHGAAHSLTIAREVLIAEPLGTETMLITEFGGAEVQGKMLNPRVVHPGEQLDFTLDLSRLHVFDKASGKSLR